MLPVLSPILVCVIGMLSIGWSSATFAGALELLYTQRPPFMEIEPDGSLGGLSAQRVVSALRAAGIEFSLREASPSARLKAIAANTHQVCSVGFYKTKQREAIGNFSLPVSQDLPFVAIVRKLNAPLPGVKLDDVLTDSQSQVLVKEAIYYGPYLDQRLSKISSVPTFFRGERAVDARNPYLNLLSVA